MIEQRPLRPLHGDSTLSRTKLAVFEKMASTTLIQSLSPGQEHSLKARPDGLMLDGHHRVYVLRARGTNVDSLPREIMQPEGSP